jgi:hypothetical protein
MSDIALPVHRPGDPPASFAAMQALCTRVVAANAVEGPPPGPAPGKTSEVQLGPKWSASVEHGPHGAVRLTLKSFKTRLPLVLLLREGEVQGLAMALLGR